MSIHDGYLFTPLAGQYTDEDRTRAFANQPLDNLPDYLNPDPRQRFQPPLMHLGWIIDARKLFAYAEEHCSQLLVYNADSTPNYESTFGKALLSYILSDLEISNDTNRIHFRRVVDGKREDLNSVLGATIGTNYDGCISQEAKNALNTFFAPEVPAGWFLDQSYWQWKDGRSKHKCKPSKKKLLPAPPCYISPLRSPPFRTVTRRYLFMPITDKYTREACSPLDSNRSFKSQPLDHLPRYLIPGWLDQNLSPPTLHLGWVVSLPKVFEYAQQHLPGVVRYSGNPPEPDCVETFTCLSFDGVNVQNSWNTFLSRLFPLLDIPGRPSHRLRFVGAYDGNCLENGPQNVLSLGTNYIGCVSEHVMEKLNEFFAPGVKPRWFLYPYDYKWRGLGLLSLGESLNSLPDPRSPYSVDSEA